MKRSLFLLISGIIGLLFGSMFLFTSSSAAEGFGISPTPQTLMLLRAMGEAIFAMGVMGILVRNAGDSKALKAILIFNVIYHGLALVNDFYCLQLGIIDFTKTLPAIIVHLFIGIGSLYFALKIKNTTD
jgi:hypothetical protein